METILYPSSLFEFSSVATFAVGSAEELERAIPFPVDYTHQLFEGEMIKWEDGGPDENSDLSIKIVYSSPGFSCWVDWEGVPKCEEERLMVNLSKALPDTRTRSKQAFLKHIEDWKPVSCRGFALV